MMRELDRIVLNRDIEEHNLRCGDVGVVVHCYLDKAVYEVEFITAEGKTIALLTLTDTDIRPMANREILHVRELTPV